MLSTNIPSQYTISPILHISYCPLYGLQTVDAFNVALPADWRPGDEVIDPNPGNMKGVEERWEKSQKADSGVKCYDWFFCTREIPCDEIHKKIGK